MKIQNINKVHIDLPEPTPENQKEQIDLSVIIRILQSSLNNAYQVNEKKFNVERLFKNDMILDSDTQQALITKVKFKVNCENKPLNKLVIDFGPYPLHKNWLLKKKEQKEGQVLLKQSLNKGRKDSKNLFIMPD